MRITIEFIVHCVRTKLKKINRLSFKYLIAHRAFYTDIQFHSITNILGVMLGTLHVVK